MPAHIRAGDNPWKTHISGLASKEVEIRNDPVIHIPQGSPERVRTTVVIILFNRFTRRYSVSEGDQSATCSASKRGRVSSLT